MQNFENLTIKNLSKTAFLFPSIIIFLYIFIQGGTVFKLWCSPDSLSFLPKIKVACDPTLYPFMTYPMFSSTHKVGDTIQKYYVYGILKDKTEVLIDPDDFGFVKHSFWLFRLHVLLPLRYNDAEKIANFVKAYEAKTQQEISAIRLEVHPLELTENGYRQRSRKIVKVFNVSDEGKE